MTGRTMVLNKLWFGINKQGSLREAEWAIGCPGEEHHRCKGPEAEAWGRGWGEVARAAFYWFPTVSETGLGWVLSLKTKRPGKHSVGPCSSALPLPWARHLGKF